jgi:hypothetical protein
MSAPNEPSVQDRTDDPKWAMPVSNENDDITTAPSKLTDAMSGLLRAIDAVADEGAAAREIHGDQHGRCPWDRLARCASSRNRSLARELAEQVPGLGTVVVPCGGGGLLSGVILGLAGMGVRVVGVESEASPSMSAAVAAGGIVPINVDMVLEHQVEILTVSESDIRSSMVFSAHKMGLVLEGAGAVGVAALRAGVITPDTDGRATVVILTGRNVAPKLLSEVLHS